MVVFAHHKEVVGILMDAFTEAGMNPVKVVGGMTKEDRQASKDTFQTDPSVRVFVGNIQAAGVGLTLTAASHVIFAELDWVPGNVTQGEDRCHRLGSEKHESINVTHLVFDGTLDARMAKTVVEKQQVADRALDTGDDMGTLDIDVPLVPTAKTGHLPVKPKSYPQYTEAQKQAAREVVAHMTALDPDHALSANAAGWSAAHGRIGHDLAGRSIWTDGQTWLAVKILRPYRNTQLRPEWVETLWPEEAHA